MKKILFSFILFVLIVSIKGHAPSEVVVLTEANFEELVLKGNDNWFVKFYAPWCGHCKKMADDWIKLATLVKGKFKVGEVDATVHEKLKATYANGFPTLKLIKAG